jgi:hypothetical protein
LNVGEYNTVDLVEEKRKKEHRFSVFYCCSIIFRYATVRYDAGVNFDG